MAKHTLDTAHLSSERQLDTAHLNHSLWSRVPGEEDVELHSGPHRGYPQEQRDWPGAVGGRLHISRGWGGPWFLQEGVTGWLKAET